MGFNSLVNSLQYFADQEDWSQEDKEEFRESLITIQKKTVHMLEFVDNYRELSSVPHPKNGHLTFKSVPGETTFIMSFL